VRLDQLAFQAVVRSFASAILGHTGGMTQMQRLGAQMQAALAADVPAELVAFVTTTQHAGRLQTLFLKSSQRLLRTHQEAQARPQSTLAQFERQRSKALVDLVRARMALAGMRKPGVDKMMALMGATGPSKVVDLRRAA
jgi:hypothetical protein